MKSQEGGKQLLCTASAVLNGILKYYYLCHLTKTEKKICTAIVKAILQLQNEVRIPDVSVDMDAVNRILNVIRIDFPECYYFHQGACLIWFEQNAVRLKLGYFYTKEEIRQYDQKIKAVTRRILSVIPETASIEEKEKILHDYLVKRVKYALNAPLTPKLYTIVGPLLYGSAVCEGYAKAYKYLCDLVKVPCLYVSATALNMLTGKKERHGWNIVMLRKKGFCHVDVTWDSCGYHGNNSAYTYYNQTDAQMEPDHFWDHSIVPACHIRAASPILYCDSHSDLEQLICRNVRSARSYFVVRVNEGFRDANAVVDFTARVCARNRLPIRFSIVYQPERHQIEFSIIR